MPHEGYDISNQGQFDCLFNKLVKLRTGKHQSSKYRSFVRGIYQWWVDSPYTKASNAEKGKCFHVMMSSWLWRNEHYINISANRRAASRADSRLVPSQWETSLQWNTVSHWLGTNLESISPELPSGGSIAIVNEPCNNINSLWPSHAICCHRTGSTLAQVMACCLMAPSHHLNQYWLIIGNILWHSPEAISQEMLRISIPDMSFKITNLRVHPHFPGANELITVNFHFIFYIYIYIYPIVFQTI